MDHQNRRVKIHRSEMECLLDLKSRLDYKETVASYAEEYQKLGWVLQAVNPQDGTDLNVDCDEDPGAWVNRLWEPGLSEPKINLGVRTGKPSRLLVLEIALGPGEPILDQYGPWRAECIAALGAGRERHFYAWEPSPCFDPAALRATPAIRWFGEGQVVLVPPSSDPGMAETWQWRRPPWEKAPQYPSQSLSRFLQHPPTWQPGPRREVSLSRQEVDFLVSPHAALLEALSASHPSMQKYYQGILKVAKAVGLNAPAVLLSLLWHAPRGNARQHAEIWGHLQKLVAEAQAQPEAVTSPGNLPWELFPDNASSLTRETSAGNAGQPAEKSGPSCFLRRRPAQPPQPGPLRTPLSCRKPGGGFGKV